MNEDLEEAGKRAGSPPTAVRPTAAQAAYLRRGLDQAGGKLPLFDREGQRYSRRTIQSCIDQGWAEPWFRNPVKPDWLICRLTDAGLAAVSEDRAQPAPLEELIWRARQGSRCDARWLQLLVRDQLGRLVEA